MRAQIEDIEDCYVNSTNHDNSRADGPNGTAQNAATQQNRHCQDTDTLALVLGDAGKVRVRSSASGTRSN